MNVTVPPVLFVIVCSKRKGLGLLLQLANSVGGLKKVTKLEVNEALETVTWVGKMDLPGRSNTPPLPGTWMPPMPEPKTGTSRASSTKVPGDWIE